MKRNRKASIMTHILRVSVLLSLNHSIQTTAAINSSPSYIGAVVEYHPVTDGDDGQMIADANANNYRTIIKNASTYKVDIIVFPEFGLTSLPKDGDGEKQFNATAYRDYYRNTASYIPSPKETVILCDAESPKYKSSLQTISCAAKEYRMYVVVNHHEKAGCPKPSNCSPDGFLLYNTNVVFDRSGRVVARYRKYNLFNEAGTNVTAKPEASIFTTDFGVTFGQLICFDIVNEKPAMFYARHPNVTDVVFSTHWYDELPFLDATQVQAAWAYGADVNLLAAGYSDSLTASGGSGIYAGKNGPIKLFHPRETSNALVVAEIPKLKTRRDRIQASSGNSLIHVYKQAEVPTVYPHQRRRNVGDHDITADERGPIFLRDDLEPYTTRLVDEGQHTYITTLCDRGLCCDFHVATSYDEKLVAAKPGAKQYRYRLAAFNGVRSFANQSTGGLEVCAVISCAGDAIDDCGRLYPPSADLIRPMSFDSLIIIRRAKLEPRSFYAPSTFTQDLEPLANDEFAYVSSGHENSSQLLMSLVRPSSELMTFAIYGRRFDRDGETATKADSTAAAALVPTVLMIVLAMLAMRA